MLKTIMISIIIVIMIPINMFADECSDDNNSTSSSFQNDKSSNNNKNKEINITNKNNSLYFSLVGFSIENFYFASFNARYEHFADKNISIDLAIKAGGYSLYQDTHRILMFSTAAHCYFNDFQYFYRPNISLGIATAISGSNQNLTAGFIGIELFNFAINDSVSINLAPIKIPIMINSGSYYSSDHAGDNDGSEFMWIYLNVNFFEIGVIF